MTISSNALTLWQESWTKPPLQGLTKPPHRKKEQEERKENAGVSKPSALAKNKNPKKADPIREAIEKNNELVKSQKEQGKIKEELANREDKT